MTKCCPTLRTYYDVKWPGGVNNASMPTIYPASSSLQQKQSKTKRIKTEKGSGNLPAFNDAPPLLLASILLLRTIPNLNCSKGCT